eukprot:1156899-Pelagomonas_calceolata.AAC.7
MSVWALVDGNGTVAPAVAAAEGGRHDRKDCGAHQRLIPGLLVHQQHRCSLARAGLQDLQAGAVHAVHAARAAHAGWAPGQALRVAC